MGTLFRHDSFWYVVDIGSTDASIVTAVQPTGADDGYHAEPAQRMLDAWNRATRAFSAPHIFDERRRLADSPLTDPTHERVLEMIAERGPVRSSTVAELTFMTASNASKVADALVRAGLVERTIPPSDRRVTLLALTNAGSALVARMQAVALELLTDRVHRFTQREVDTLAGLLEIFSLEVEQWSQAVRAGYDEVRTQPDSPDRDHH